MNRSFLPLALLLGASLLFSGCLKDSCEINRTYNIFTPVYKPLAEIREGVGVQAPRALRQPGKIYSYGPYLLINELREGLHIFDNSNPSAPQAMAFLAIPGNADMAVYQNVLYADSYMDLLSFDISTITQPVLVDRKEDVFHQWLIEPEGVIVDYVMEKEQVTRSCEERTFFEWGDRAFAADATFGNLADASFPSSVSQAMGVGGSMARFTIAAGHLYAVDRSDLHVFGLTVPQAPQSLNRQSIGWDIETIYPFGQYLFIGSETGMYIFDNSIPTSPSLLSIFEHARACDPVVSDGEFAFVTLRSGNVCQGFNNQLDVIDVKNPLQPRLLHSWPMTHPMGLAIRGDLLFLCDDTEGLRIFDRSDVLQLGNRQLARLGGFQAFDVIALPGGTLILVIGKDGLRQYDTAQPAQPVLLSSIPVTP
jgi:hypothetical protein